MFRQNHRRDKKKRGEASSEERSQSCRTPSKIEAAAQQKLQERERMEQAAAERLTKTPVETHQPMVEEPAAPTPVQIDSFQQQNQAMPVPPMQQQNRNESRKKRRQMKLVFSNLKFLKKRKIVIINYHQLIC